MDLLNEIGSLKGISELLGVHLFRERKSCTYLPQSFHIFGCCERLIFAFVEGFQNTVFCVSMMDGRQPEVYPIAYDFRDFLRLILSCGSAYTVAALSMGMAVEEIKTPSDSRYASFWTEYSIDPVPDARRYLQTVMELIDTSSILG